jgi:hypothetical protein
MIYTFEYLGVVTYYSMYDDEGIQQGRGGARSFAEESLFG